MLIHDVHLVLKVHLGTNTLADARLGIDGGSRVDQCPGRRIERHHPDITAVRVEHNDCVIARALPGDPDIANGATPSEQRCLDESSPTKSASDSQQSCGSIRGPALGVLRTTSLCVDADSSTSRRKHGSAGDVIGVTNEVLDTRRVGLDLADSDYIFTSSLRVAAQCR